MLFLLLLVLVLFLLWLLLLLVGDLLLVIREVGFVFADNGETVLIFLKHFLLELQALLQLL